MPVIADLYLYPLKSAAGVRLESAALDRFGLAGDRRWVLVDDRGILTQRELPRLALIRPLSWSDELTLAAPGMPDLRVAVPGDETPTVDVTVWNDRCAGRDAGDDAARWASAFLEHPCRLLHAPATMVRRVNPAFDRPASVEASALVAYSDGFPLLLIGQASLDGLNERLRLRDESPVPMNRFRPNLVVSGAGPHDEDEWAMVAVEAHEGPIRLEIAKPCERCAIVPVDQATGVRGREPLRTLATYRTRNGKVYYGQNVIHRSAGVLRVGAAVSVLERRPGS